MAVGASLFGFASVVGAQSSPAPSPTTNGRRPAGMKDDEAVVFDFCSVLHPQHFVDDALFQRAVSVLGERGMVDLIGVSGYYNARVHGPQRGGGPAARRRRFTVVSERVSGTRAPTPRLLRRR